MSRTQKILLVLIVLYIIPWGAVAFDWTWYFAWGNTIFHFLGGFFIAKFIASYYATQFSKLSQPLRFFALLGMVISVGVFWEFYETLFNALSGNLLPGLDDTIKDLAMDVIGGAIGSNPLRGGNGEQG